MNGRDQLQELCRRHSGYEDSSESLLVKQVHVELPVSVARGDGRPPRIDRPLHANDLRIALRHILDVCERSDRAKSAAAASW